MCDQGGGPCDNGRRWRKIGRLRMSRKSRVEVTVKDSTGETLRVLSNTVGRINKDLRGVKRKILNKVNSRYLTTGGRVDLSLTR